MPVAVKQGRGNIPATTYSHTQCKIGVVHLGYGSFHRAHQAVYLDDYMEQSRDLRWAIAAVNLRATESHAFKQSQVIDNGYLLKSMSPTGEREMRLVRSHHQFEDWTKNPDRAEQLLSLPTVHMVTMTVTESGYYLNNDRSLNTNDPLIKAEISGNASNSVYAYLARALRLRASLIDQPINVLCCDNIRSNGRMLERNFLTYLQKTSQNELYDWVKDNVAFPCSMVDRITPRTSSDLINETMVNFPGVDLSPVQAESFSQWVLERRFLAPIPDLTSCGVEIVSDVNPYEEAKVRILNGGHTGLCYFGALAGYTTFDQAFRDPRLRKIFDAFQCDEVLPGLDMEIPFDKLFYLEQIAERFSNEAISDQLERICMDGYSKMPMYIKPTLESCLSKNITPTNTFKCIASWYVYARRFSQGLTSLHYHEPFWEQLAPMLVAGNEINFARCEQLWGDLPNQYAMFVSELVSAIRELELAWKYS